MSAVLNTPAKPPMVRPEQGTSLPDALIARSQWVNWTYEHRNGRLTKCPRTVSGAFAKADTPSTWSEYAAVMTASERNPEMGIGYVFAEDDPFAGIDLDNCLRPDGFLKNWAVPIVDRFGRTYAEVSPSGIGLKIWVRASLAGLVSGTGTRRKCGDGEVEVYDRGRFFTVTGRRWAESQLDVLDHQPNVEWLLDQIGAQRPSACVAAAAPEVVTEIGGGRNAPREVASVDEAALQAKLQAARTNVAKFEELWLGGACGYYSSGKPDSSRADLAFCNMLAYHLELDAEAVDMAFRMSERMRPKWDEKHYSDGRTYGQATVQKAVDWAAEERQRSALKNIPANVKLDGATMDDLNAMPIFKQIGVVWEKFEMSGDQIFGYAGGQRVKWENTAELLSFAKSQAIILKYLRVLIPSPPRAKVKAIWEPAAGLMVMLAAVVNSGDEMQVELADLLPMCFRRAGSPVAWTDADLFRYMYQIRAWKRDPYAADPIVGGAAPGPFVFLYDNRVFVNAYKLRLWASLPRVTAAMLKKSEVARELGSLGFKYTRSFERTHEDKRISMDFWIGPSKVLEGWLDDADPSEQENAA